MTRPRGEDQPPVAPEVQLDEAVVASVGNVPAGSDADVERPSVAHAPTQPVTNPLPAGSSESTPDVIGAPIKASRQMKSRQHTLDDVMPVLCDDVTKLLVSQVGEFTHALCAPRSGLPAYFEPASASKVELTVKSAPAGRDHVLCVRRDRSAAGPPGQDLGRNDRHSQVPRDTITIRHRQAFNSSGLLHHLSGSL